MTERGTADEFNELHGLYTRAMKAILDKGTEATPAELKLVAQHLKDNNVTGLATNNSPLAGLLDALNNEEDQDQIEADLDRAVHANG